MKSRLDEAGRLILNPVDVDNPHIGFGDNEVAVFVQGGKVRIVNNRNEAQAFEPSTDGGAPDSF